MVGKVKDTGITVTGSVTAVRDFADTQRLKRRAKCSHRDNGLGTSPHHHNTFGLIR